MGFDLHDDRVFDGFLWVFQSTSNLLISPKKPTFPKKNCFYTNNFLLAFTKTPTFTKKPTNNPKNLLKNTKNLLIYNPQKNWVSNRFYWTLPIAMCESILILKFVLNNQIQEINWFHSFNLNGRTKIAVFECDFTLSSSKYPSSFNYFLVKSWFNLIN